MPEQVLVYNPFVDVGMSRDVIRNIHEVGGSTPKMEFPYGTSIAQAGAYATQHDVELVVPTLGPGFPSEWSDKALRALLNVGARFHVLDRPAITHDTAEQHFREALSPPTTIQVEDQAVPPATHPLLGEEPPVTGPGRRSAMDADAVLQGLENARLQGCATLKDVTSYLNNSGVDTPSGHGTWTSAKVSRVAERLGVTPWWTTRKRKGKTAQ